MPNQPANRLPGSLRILCESASEYGVSVEQCLAGTDLTLLDLFDSETRICIEQEFKAIENFLRHAPEPVGLGIDIGLKIKPETLGIWGYAILASQTVRASIATAIAYYQLSFMMAPITVVERGEEARVTFDLTEIPKSLRRFVLERHMTVLNNFANAQMQGRFTEQATLRTTEADAPFARAVEEKLGFTVQADDAINAVVVPKYILDQELPHHNPELLAVCLKQCARLQGVADDDSWSARVHEAVLPELRNAPSIKSVALELGTSDRTLTRRLTNEGTSFREILLKARLAVAQELLTTTTLSVSNVAWRAGYREPASFVRAFRKQYGHPPGQLRKGAQQAS